jgi:hypothetical protein
VQALVQIRLQEEKTMPTRKFKTLTAAALLAALVTSGVLIDAKSARADRDRNAPHDEDDLVQMGLEVAASSGIQLNMKHKDRDLVGLGSYLVNVVADCNGCHTADPATEYLPNGNPYLRQPPGGPFLGTKKINPATYLGGGSDFGAFPSPLDGSGQPTVHIVSRNLTPDKSGRPEGGRTLTEFIQIIRTGVDLDHVHPNCPTNTPQCLNAPFNGDLLQVMPWPSFQNMTDHQLEAIYTYLSAIPCLEGGPGEPPNRCQ